MSLVQFAEAPARSHSRRVAAGWMAVPAFVAVVAVPFAAFASLVLDHFYLRGSFVLDSGLQAYLLSHGGPLLSYPAALGGGSYLRSHVVPVFACLWLLRQALRPLSDVQFFAAFIGLAHALPGLGVFWVLRSGYRLRGVLVTAAAALIAIAFDFNGLALAIARYPHFEMLLVGSMICFAVALVRRRLIAAGLFFALALATREDAGFHLFGILFVLTAVNRWYGAPWRAQRAELGFAAAGLGYSLVLVAVQSALASGSSALAQTYIGEPPFATLTLATVTARLLGYMAFRAYIVLPALIAIGWAARTRNPYILVGYVAFLPWGLLQLVARSDIAGTLSGYYGFPFMIASFWPLVGVLLLRDRARRCSGVADSDSDGNGSFRPALPVALFAAMIAASLVGIGHQYNPGGLDLPAAFFSAPTLVRQAATDRAVAAFAASEPVLGRIVADTSVVALAPDKFTPGETVTGRDRALPPDTVVYLAHGYDAARVRRLAAAAGLAWHYRVPGTAIRIATNRPLLLAGLVAAGAAGD